MDTNNNMRDSENNNEAMLNLENVVNSFLEANPRIADKLKTFIDITDSNPTTPDGHVTSNAGSTPEHSTPEHAESEQANPEHTNPTPSVSFFQNFPFNNINTPVSVKNLTDMYYAFHLLQLLKTNTGSGSARNNTRKDSSNNNATTQEAFPMGMFNSLSSLAEEIISTFVNNTITSNKKTEGVESAVRDSKPTTYHKVTQSDAANGENLHTGSLHTCADIIDIPQGYTYVCGKEPYHSGTHEGRPTAPFERVTSYTWDSTNPHRRKFNN